MKQFSIFVDGSNLFGSIRELNLEIEDHQLFFKHVFAEGIKSWRECIVGDIMPVQLQRVNWYLLSTIDVIDISDPSFKISTKERFLRDRTLRDMYLREADGSRYEEKLENAFESFFRESSEWYTKKRDKVESSINFFRSVQSRTNFIDVIDCGHLKVDFLHQIFTEKGIDTRLAIDIATTYPSYDIALVISGDADFIPSFNYVKRFGKQIGSVEFIKGMPPENRGSQFSSRLRAVSDFVVQIYEADLIKEHIAKKFIPRRTDD